MKNYLTAVLAEIVDEEHLALALKIDEHICQKWETAGEDFKLTLESFEHSSSANAAAEFAIYILLTEAMQEDGRV